MNVNAMPPSAGLRAGARNLLENCVGLASGDTVLIVREDSALGYYDDASPEAIECEARAMGAKVSALTVPLVSGPADVPANLIDAMEQARHTVFMGRIGDQVRFTQLSGEGTKTMCYALDQDLLGSDFCALPHAMMEELKRRLETALDTAAQWRITCPLGTDVTGRFIPPAGAGDVDDFSLRLFPVVTFRPIPCTTMSGRVAVAHWLMPTGNRTYEPCEIMLDEPVFANVDCGRIAGFDGPKAAVSKVRGQHDFVSRKFGIDPDLVHSWHVGINPRTYYPRPAVEGLERWGGVAFASPRYLHFHTCGDYAPGEICWSLFDASVEVDGEAFWTDGRFTFLERAENRALIEATPGAEVLFEPRTDIGI